MTKKYIFTVSDIENKKRLDLYLGEQEIFNSRSIIQNLIKRYILIY